MQIWFVQGPFQQVPKHPLVPSLLLQGTRGAWYRSGSKADRQTACVLWGHEHSRENQQGIKDHGKQPVQTRLKWYKTFRKCERRIPKYMFIFLQAGLGWT